jgi:hypothetical protein
MDFAGRTGAREGFDFEILEVAALNCRKRTQKTQKKITWWGEATDEPVREDARPTEIAFESASRRIFAVFALFCG